jgi:hypothetical protein
LGRKFFYTGFKGTKDAAAFRAIHNRCDICNDRIECIDDIEDKIDMLQDIDDSYESEIDKHEPMLLLCSYCIKEYGIPSYPYT